jgi:hypothetical protein
MFIAIIFMQNGLSQDDTAEGEDQDGGGHSAHGQVPACQERDPAYWNLAITRINLPLLFCLVKICIKFFILIITFLTFKKSNSTISTVLTGNSPVDLSVVL